MKFLNVSTFKTINESGPSTEPCSTPSYLDNKINSDYIDVNDMNDNYTYNYLFFYFDMPDSI